MNHPETDDFFVDTLFQMRVIVSSYSYTEVIHEVFH